MRVGLPEAERLLGSRFVESPGMEGFFAHNTEAAREWLPNVGFALVR